MGRINYPMYDGKQKMVETTKKIMYIYICIYVHIYIMYVFMVVYDEFTSNRVLLRIPGDGVDHCIKEGPLLLVT